MVDLFGTLAKKDKQIVDLFLVTLEKDQQIVDLFVGARNLGKAPTSRKISTMPRPKASPWGRLFKLAASQEGLFSAAQATEVGVTQQLLGRYLASGKVERVRRALYRVAGFPLGQYEDLISAWLWSRNEGVFSHETALFLHELSDALPTRTVLSLPIAWKARKVKVPEGIVLHYQDIQEGERSWIGPLPVTSVRRTISDCLRSDVPAELVSSATTHAAERGLIGTTEVLPAASINLWRKDGRE